MLITVLRVRWKLVRKSKLSFVKLDVVFDCRNQLVSVGEFMKIVHFGFENSPIALHRSVVYTMTDSGHTLPHSCLHQFVVERLVCILKSSVAVEQRTGIRIHCNSFVKGGKDKFIVVAVTNLVGKDPPVIQVEDSTQIEFLYFRSDIIFEFRHVC